MKQNRISVVITAVMWLLAAAACTREAQYSVTVTVVGGGTATASPSSSYEGGTVSLRATPHEGYAFRHWTVMSGEVALHDAMANPAEFTLGAEDVVVQATFTEAVPHDEALYHEGVGAWIVPRPDPYAQDNMRRALDNLRVRGGEDAEYLPTQVSATHLALSIFPRNEDEQWQLELLEDVAVAYIPFTFAGLTAQEGQKIEESTTRADRPTFSEENPHVVTGDDFVQTVDEEENALSVSQAMPTLYAAWPVDKPLPEELDYRVDYPVYIPSTGAATRGAATPEARALRRLEDEAVALALGRPSTRAAGSRATGTVLSGRFETWEVLREVRVPIPRIQVTFSLGSKVVETEADPDGYFSVAADDIPEDASWDIAFRSEKWKVTRANSTVPKSFFQGKVYQPAFWSENNTLIRTTVQPSDATIINALNYYYHSTHHLSKWGYEGGIRVIAESSESAAYNGMFSYSGSGTCYITIYRNNSVSRNRLAGTVLHELGHFIHFRERDGYQGMRNTDKLLQESFASYVGWYLASKYYDELGYERRPDEDISGQGRQYWLPTSTKSSGAYSPLMVDLVDSYNQSTYSPSYNRDEVKGDNFHTLIMRAAGECASWDEFKALLTGQSTNSSQSWGDFLKPYEDWRARTQQ